MRKMMVAAVLAGMLALTMAPAFAGTAASPDDTARFLAGLPVPTDSPLAPLTNDADWQQHAHAFNALFAREDTNTLSKVRAFSAAHLGNYHDAMLYFFSGPDFLYATSFFSHASTYVMAGLEPAGDIPQLTDLSRGSVDQTLQNLQVSLKTILNISFFITKDMQSQLNDGQVYGTLPVLYVFLARTGKTVHEASFVSLDAQGNFVKPDDHPPANVTRGVKIVFSDGSGPNQTLYYFSTNLGDDGVKQSGFLAFCAKLGTADSFIKSDSYLLHGENFSKVRNFLLEHSGNILQDDSGIPVVDFDPKKWKLLPFGHYLGAMGLFPGSGQPQLAVLFRNAAPLDFGIGYRWQKDTSNLMLAERLPDATGATAAVNPSSTTPVDGAVGIAVGSPDTPGWVKSHPHYAASKPAPRPQKQAEEQPFWGWSWGYRR